MSKVGQGGGPAACQGGVHHMGSSRCSVQRPRWGVPWASAFSGADRSLSVAETDDAAGRAGPGALTVGEVPLL